MKILGRAGKLKDGLLKDLPELAKVRTKSSSKADNDVEGSVDDEPVVLGRAAVNLLLLLLVTEILLAGVRAGDKKTDDRDDLLENALLSDEDGRATGLEGSGDVSVDVGNDGTV